MEVKAMKTGRVIAAAIIGLCATGAVARYYRNREKDGVPVQAVTDVEDRFCAEWTAVLNENARVFNGLYSGLLRVQTGTANRPGKILWEWCQRTHYKWENTQVDTLCQQHILPQIESADREALMKWANLLLDAATAAGITKEEATALVLTEETAKAYVEWDGAELNPDDEIEILSPAWYQNGALLEQGQCKKAGVAQTPADVQKRNVYKFFDTDITGQAEYDIAGVQYQNLLQSCFRYCATVAVIVSLTCTEGIRSWEPYRIPVTPSVRGVYAHYGLPMDGTTARTDFYEIRHYALTPQMKRELLNHATSLFQWTCAWGYHNPDDLSFYRPDGSVFFSSLVHEGECTLYLRENEDLSDVISQGNWTLA